MGPDGTSQVLLVPSVCPWSLAGCPEPCGFLGECDRSDIFLLDARVCNRDARVCYRDALT